MPDFRQLVEVALAADKEAEETERTSACDRAVTAWSAVVDEIQRMQIDTGERADALSRAAGALLRRFRVTHERSEDLATATSWLNEGVEAAADAPERAMYLSNLGTVLQERYLVDGSPEMLDEAVERFENAISLAEDDDPDLPMYLNNLGNALADRCARGSVEEVPRAVALAHQAVALLPEGSPDAPLYLNNLGNALVQSLEVSGDRDDLDAAVAALRTAVRRAEHGTDDHAMFLANLGNALQTRAMETGRPGDLKAALRAYRRASRATHHASPDLPSRLAGRADVLREQYVRRGRLATLDQAIAIYDRVLESEPNANALPAHWNNLANCLRDRYLATGRRADVERAVDLSRQAVASAVPEGSPSWRRYMGNLGSGLRLLYLLDGRESDLEEAIVCCRRSLTTDAGRAGTRARRLGNLANALHDRFTRTGELADLEGAIAAQQQAARLVPDDDDERPRILGNLAAVLAERHDLIGDRADLDEAITYSRTAAEAPSSPSRATYLDNLGTVLTARFRLNHDAHARDRDSGDLAEALSAQRRALWLTPRNSDDHVSRLSNYGAGLLTRNRTLLDVLRAVHHLRRAVRRAHPDDPDLPRYRANLANALRQRHARLSHPADLREAAEIYHLACESSLKSATAVALYAARDWSTWADARRSWSESALAHELALQAMERLFRVQIVRGHSETWLREAAGQAAAAGYAHAKIGSLAAAVTSIERGRALLLSDALDRGRADLHQLETGGHVELAEKYRRLARQVGQARQ